MSTPKRFALWVFVGLALILFLTWEQIQATRFGYNVEQVRTAIQTQENLNAYLRMELQEWKSPARIMDQAHRRLGMSPATPAAIVLMIDSTAGNPGGLLSRMFARPSESGLGHEPGR